MNIILFIVLLFCTLIISAILATPVINGIEHIADKVFNKEIEILDWQYLLLVLFLWAISMCIFYNYFISLDTDYLV